MIDAAAAELQRRVTDLLGAERLSPSSDVGYFATPRRLAVYAHGVPAGQPDVEEQVTGPAAKVAFKDGKPAPPAEAFAKKVGLPVEKLEKVTTPKGEYLSARIRRKGRGTGALLGELLPKEIAALYWPKSMYWRAGKPERFVRPVRWMVALLDGEVIPLEFAGVRAGRESRGHRVLSSGAVSIGSPKDYADALSKASVMPSPAAREEHIRKQLDAATRAIPGARWREDAELLRSVVNLTEWPSVVLGSFDREYLSLPEEVLVTVMRDHQKYFAVEDASGKLAPHFLAVLNTTGDPAVIRHGNERVLRARFNDARFFWQQDQKISMKDRVALLKAVTFQKDLGNYYDKTIRVQKLASVVSEILKDAGVAIRPGVIHKAALLAKADLTTEMVKEFTELQGIVGGLYTRAQTIDEMVPEATRFAIADAVYDQYKPESMDDRVPRTVEGAVLALADKADTIAGMFALGLAPSGSKDPFALRRAANGIVKTIAEHKLPLSLTKLFVSAINGHDGSPAQAKFARPEELMKSAGKDPHRVLWQCPTGATAACRALGVALERFMTERLEFYLRDVRGFAYDVVKAVLAAGNDDVVDAIARAEAVTRVRGSEDFAALSVAFKRIRNILRQAEEKEPGASAGELSSGTLEGAEKDLFDAMRKTSQTVEPLRGNKKYEQALTEISRLRPVVDAFFDKVMVMAEDREVRRRRLRLLGALLGEFSRIADFSEIVTEGKS